MKILLSAYACEPNRGSEPGVGWNWAIELLKLGHEVWVLTRANNRNVIEAELQKAGYSNKLHFIYYDLPDSIMRWKHLKGGVQIYYQLWQWFAYKKVKQVHNGLKFDIVHHITFGVFRQPSFMGNLGAQFIFGPVGGGEKAPCSLRRSYSFKGWIIDLLRDILNSYSLIDPLMYNTYSKAELIYTKTPETLHAIPKKFHNKSKVQLEIGIRDIKRPINKNTHKDAIKILYAGRYLYWKGMDIGIKAFAKHIISNPNSQLIMVGNGPEKKRWESIAINEGIEDKIKWINWLPQNDLFKLYEECDVLLFPSLHDSSGNVVLEALSFGLPVICLDLGGPGVIVDSTCGIKIDTYGLSCAHLIEKISNELNRVSSGNNLAKKLSDGAYAKAKTFSWDRTVKNIYNNF